MKDFNILTEALDQRASGTIEVLDYDLLDGKLATGTVTVIDYTKLIGVKASGTVTIVDYTQLAGKTVTVNGTVLTEGADWTAAVDNATTAASLELAIEAVTNINSSAVGAVITVEAAAVGVAGNAYTLATNADPAGLTISGATLTGGVDEGTVTVNGTVLTQGSDFNAATDNATTATSLESAIEAVTNINSSVLGAVITVNAAAVGTAGNAYTLATNAPLGVTLSGATLTGGQAAGTFTIGSDTITEGSDFNAETDNETTATNIAAAIEALTGVGATADGAVVTITNDASGTAGNSKALTTNASESAVTLSGATLSGGVAATYSEVIELASVEELKNLEIVGFLESISGSGTPTLTATPQYSMDKVNFFDHTTSFATGFTVINTPQKLDLDFTALYLRFKLVNSGTNTIATFRVEGVAK